MFLPPKVKRSPVLAAITFMMGSKYICWTVRSSVLFLQSPSRQNERDYGNEMLDRVWGTPPKNVSANNAHITLLLRHLRNITSWSALSYVFKMVILSLGETALFPVSTGSRIFRLQIIRWYILSIAMRTSNLVILLPSLHSLFPVATNVPKRVPLLGKHSTHCLQEVEPPDLRQPDSTYFLLP